MYNRRRPEYDANMNIETLSSGTADPVYNEGWNLAEADLRAGLPSNGPINPKIVDEAAFEGYRDRMGIHTFNELETP